jgi:outer membrane biosynthesis protein TonB
MALPLHRTIACAAAAALAAGACTQTERDPFGRRFTPEHAMPQQLIPGCTPADLERPPKLVAGVRPAYPISRWAADQDATVIATFTVAEDGSLRDYDAESAASDFRGAGTRADADPFRNHVLLAMSTWRFEPALRGGAPAPATCRMEYRFSVALHVPHRD